MTAGLKHGPLRLSRLKLLGDQPRHGYDVISLLEDRFLGLYAPSAGTVYPRLGKLEGDGVLAAGHGGPAAVQAGGRWPRRARRGRRPEGLSADRCGPRRARAEHRRVALARAR